MTELCSKIRVDFRRRLCRRDFDKPVERFGRRPDARNGTNERQRKIDAVRHACVVQGGEFPARKRRHNREMRQNQAERAFARLRQASGGQHAADSVGLQARAQ